MATFTQIHHASSEMTWLWLPSLANPSGVRPLTTSKWDSMKLLLNKKITATVKCICSEVTIVNVCCYPVGFACRLHPALCICDCTWQLCKAECLYAAWIFLCCRHFVNPDTLLLSSTSTFKQSAISYSRQHFQLCNISILPSLYFILPCRHPWHHRGNNHWSAQLV